MSIGRKIKNKLAALLLGNDFVILTAEEHQTYISMKQEYERKTAECEQMIQSLQVEQDEYEYLKHLADTLVRLEKRLHNTDNASEILKETFRAPVSSTVQTGQDFWKLIRKRMYGGRLIGYPLSRAI